jgi:hypothetical protein
LFRCKFSPFLAIFYCVLQMVLLVVLSFPVST